MGIVQVISPEGAASILGRYKDDAHKQQQFPLDCVELAEVQQIYADQLLKKGVCLCFDYFIFYFLVGAIDSIIWEEEDLGREKETFQNYSNIKRRFLTWAWTELKKVEELCQTSGSR
jgi:acetyl-CoA carboxylase alpha subunit